MLKLFSFCFLVFFHLITRFTFGQTENKMHVQSDPKPNLFIYGGLSFQKQLVGEIAMGYGHRTAESLFGDIRDVRIGTEFNFNLSNFFLAPKLSTPFVECLGFGNERLLMLGIRLNVIDYTNFIYHDFKFTPEIGFQLDDLEMNLMYGYNISLNTKRISIIGTHRITLIVVL